MRRTLRSWLWRVPVDQEVDEELGFHIEMRTRELVASGMHLDAARAEALRRAGDLRRVRRTCVDIGRKRDREMRITRWVEELRDDVKFAMRQLRAAPAFTVVAVLTLALGIGANATVFGVVKSVLLDPLPYAEPDRLVRIYGRRTDGSQERGPLSAATVRGIRARQSSFTRVGAFLDVSIDAVYGSDEAPQIVRLAWIEPGFLETLGVSPARGRALRPDETASGLVPVSGGQDGTDTASAVLISHSAWQRLLGGDPAVIGRTVRLNGLPRTVVGVLPEDFIAPMGPVDFFVGFDLTPLMEQPVLARGAHWLGLVARRDSGQTIDAARADVAAIGAALAREFPEDNGSIAVTAMPLSDALVGDTRTPLVMLMASAALVLLIACANLAGALLSRTLRRATEFSVRMALGAGRARLVRQLMTETTVLALAGGAAGLAVAVTLLDLLRARVLPVLPPHAAVTIDSGAVVVMVGVALATGVLFGFTPALTAGRSDTSATLREQSRTASEGRRAGRLRGALVAAQIALCFSLLVGAGLLARSLWQMSAAPLGFDPEGVLTAPVGLPARDYATPEERARVFQQLLDRLQRLPGVEAAASTSALPTAMRQRLGLSAIAGRPLAGGGQPLVLSSLVSDDYFRTLRIPIRRGRTFDGRDRPDAPVGIVINESMARRYWPDGDAVGERVRLGPDPNAEMLEVIGIVGDVRNDRTRIDVEPAVYFSNRQITPGRLFLVVRAQGEPLALTTAIERELANLAPGVPLQRVTTLRSVVGEGLAARQMPVVLMTSFGALALLLASVGVYAMFATMAAAREKEFGVRIALGSRPRAVAALVLRQGAGWMTAGLAGGVIGVFVISRLVAGLLYGVRPFDAMTMATAALALTVCAAIALLIPVRRIARIDPAVVLRSQ